MSKFTDRFIERPASYSFFSSWEYDKEEWYQNYFKDNKEPANAAMKFGTLVGDSIGTPNSLVPTLTPPGIKEYELRATIAGIQCVGYCDHYCPKTKTLHENKTTANTKKWNKQSVDNHKQLDMYALLLMLQDKTHPSEVKMFLNYIPVLKKGLGEFKLPEPATYIQFPTKRTALQVANYANYIKQTVIEMEQWVKLREV